MMDAVMGETASSIISTLFLAILFVVGVAIARLRNKRIKFGLPCRRFEGNLVPRNGERCKLRNFIGPFDSIIKLPDAMHRSDCE